MNNYFAKLIIAGFLFLSACSPLKKLPAQEEVDQKTIAFPGAEGYGKYTTGGRGGRVVIVTNLNDNGIGSAREALKTSDPKTVIFGVSGTIHLTSPLRILSNVTIEGQAAPGDGICFADQPVILGGDNIIVRYLRFRLGDRYQNKGQVDGSGNEDAFGGWKIKNVIIDHCSVSWSDDEAFSIYAGDSTTLQWNIISEPLNYSYHFESGGKDFQHHGYGGIWGGKHFSGHHNLFAHCVGRTPRFDGNKAVPHEYVDLRNNVIYNWGGLGIYGGEGGTYNLINNYFKYGPSTAEKVKYQIANPWNDLPTLPFGKWYVNGNYVEGSEINTKNNWLGVKVNKGQVKDVEVSFPFPAAAVITQSAKDAYNNVLASVGASLPSRDTLDERIINDVKNGRGRIIDVQGGFPHGTPYEVTKNAWPNLKSGITLKDSDQDGIPDKWENAHGMNPFNYSDALLYTIDKRYTNIEVYLNAMVHSN